MSITITITIDGGEGLTTISSASMLIAPVQAPPNLGVSSHEEVDAGAAPSRMDLSESSGFASPPISSNAPEGVEEAIAAGAAPTETDLFPVAELPGSAITQTIPVTEADATDAGTAPSFPPAT